MTCWPSYVTRSSRRSSGPRWQPAKLISRLWSVITSVLTGAMSALGNSGRQAGFNVVLPVLIRAKDHQGNERVYVRFPLPYKVGEAEHQGNVEEKLRTEIATYIWLQTNCPDIPIPILHGFGLPDGTCLCSMPKDPGYSSMA